LKMKRLMRLISHVIHGEYWFLAAGLVLFLAGLAAGIVYKKSVGIDLFCSFLFIAGIVLISVAISKTGREVERPAAIVEEPPAQEAKPEAKKGRGARRRRKAAPETVSWDI
jgi:hypothetical protein